jgi:antitoxin CcdA
MIYTHEPCIPMTATARAAQSARLTRQRTNLTIDSTVLAEAKALGINISRACEAHLQEMVRQEKTRLWKEQHAKFLAHYNAEVERDGLPLDQWRQF